MKLRRAGWPAFNEMSFAGVVGSRAGPPRNSASLRTEFPNDFIPKASLETVNADTLDEHKLANSFQFENSKDFQQTERVALFARGQDRASSASKQEYKGSTYNGKSSYLASAAGEVTKPPGNAQFLQQSTTYRQQQIEPLSTPQYRLWNSTICSPSKSRPPSNVRSRRPSQRRTRRSPPRSQKRTELLLNDSTSTAATIGTAKLRPGHLNVVGNSTGHVHEEAENASLFTTHSPPSTIFSVDSQSVADSQLQIVGSRRQLSDSSPWHAPTKEYRLPPQAFVEFFQRNRSHSFIDHRQ